jgi:hypothetical protein
MREIEFVSRAMNGIDFHCGDHIETRLLKAEAHPSSASKKVDTDWA